MGEIRGIAVLDNRGFRAGVDGMNKEVSGFSKRLGRLKSQMQAVFTGGLIAKFVSSAVQSFAQFQDIETQFKILFRSVGDAKAHLEDLKEFSAGTPFQISGIAEASRQLFVFSDGVMGGVKSLKMVGDAAAATGQNIQDVAMWVGRAYGAIQAGRPFGEAAQRLQEMGILSGTVRNEMEKLQKQSADATQIWGKLVGQLQNFSGGMTELSKTVNGQISTMKDNWKLAIAEMGEAMAPFINFVLKGLIKIAAGFKAFVNELRQVSAWLGGMSAGLSPHEAKRQAQKMFETEVEGAAKRGTSIGMAGAARADEKKSGRKVEEEFFKALATRYEKADAAEKPYREAWEREQKTRDQFREIAAGERTRGQAVQAADRLARIGGQVGGGFSPAMRIAQKQMEIQRQMLDAIKRVPGDLAERLKQEYNLA